MTNYYYLYAVAFMTYRQLIFGYSGNIDMPLTFGFSFVIHFS